MLGLSAVMVGLFALRGRLGLGPLIMAMGILLVGMAISGRLALYVALPGGAEAPLAALLNLSLMFVGVVLVYALEGTGTAQRLILALGVASATWFLFREVIAWQLEQGADLTVHGRDRWTSSRPLASLVSAIALMLDGVVIIVAYQWLNNRRVPAALAFPIALCAAMLTDGLIYGGLSLQFDATHFVGQLWGKVLAGAVVSIPPSLYIMYEFKRFPDRINDRGLLARSAFEVITLKRQLAQARVELRESQDQNEHIRHVFGRYVAPDVVDEILASDELELGGQLRTVTILFSDIRGYSTLSEQLDPVQTIDLLNTYFTAMGEVITRFRGTIIEFEGDAILVVFGAPLDQPDHAAAAVRAALEMHRVVERLNQRWNHDGTALAWKDVGLADFRIRIGIHTGEVVVGNVGSQQRTKYAAIGDAVNTAARVEALNKELGTSLLLTAQTADMLDLPEVELIPKGEHVVRGRREPVSVLTVGGLSAT